jgi:hypothetical protein
MKGGGGGEGELWMDDRGREGRVRGGQELG